MTATLTATWAVDSNRRWTVMELRLPFRIRDGRLRLAVDGVKRTSKPLRGGYAVPGGFDSHALPPASSTTALRGSG